MGKKYDECDFNACYQGSWLFEANLDELVGIWFNNP